MMEYLFPRFNYGVAAERGLSPNGVIVKVDRTNITSAEQLRNIIKSKKSGDALLFQVSTKMPTESLQLKSRDIIKYY